MGRDKAFIEVEGMPLVRRVAGALVAGGTQWPVVVGGDRQALEALGFTYLADGWPGEGPLGGIATALGWAGGDVVVAACDLIGLDAASVAAVVDAGDDAGAELVGAGVDVVVAVTDRLEPLLARWSPTAAPVVVEALDAGERAVHRVLLDGRLRVRRVMVDPRAVRNANTPADLIHRADAAGG